MTHRIAVLLAPGFEPIEAVVPTDVWRRLGQKVTFIAESILIPTSVHGIRILTEATPGMLNPDDYDAVFLPGGAAGATALSNNPNVIEFIQSMTTQGKWICAICAAPIVLAKAGILEGKKATVYPVDELIAEITAGGAQHTPERVVQDGKVITAQGPGVSFEFAFAVAEALGMPKIDDVRKGMLIQ